MQKVYRTIIGLWALFVTTFAVSGVMAILKHQGQLQVTNSYFYLIGPFSYFVGVAALLSTSFASRHAISWSDPKKRAILQLIGSVLNGLACWFAIMGVVFMIRLVAGPALDMALPRLIASTGALLVFVYG